MMTEYLKQANETIDELKRLADLYDFAPIGYFTLDRDGRILDVNLKGARLLKADKSAVLNRPFSQFVMPDDLELFHRHCSSIFQNGAGQNCEMELLNSDGGPFFAFLESVGIRDAEDQVVQCLTVIADISHRKGIEDELQRSEQRYRHIVEDQTELICRYRSDGILTFVNSAYCRFFGKEEGELLGCSFFSLIPPRDHEQIRQMIALLNMKQPALTIQHRVELPDGKTGWQEWTNRIIYNKQGAFVEYQALGRDITDLKTAEIALQAAHDELELRVAERTAELLKEKQRLLEEMEKRNRIEEALHESEGRFRGVFEHIGVGIALISTNMEILTLNPEMQAWFPEINPGRKPLCYRAFNDPPRESVCTYCPTYKTLKDGQVHEAVADTPRGKEFRHFRIIASPLKDKKGRVVAAIEMVTDVTDSIRTHQKLLESEIMYRTVFETTGTAMMLINEDMTISKVNEEFERQSGFDRREIEGQKTWMEFVSSRDIRKMKTYHRRRRINPTSAPMSYEFQFRDKNGKLRDVLATVALIPGTTMSIASLLDVTERKQALENLKNQRQKLAVESRLLQEANTALKVLLKYREEDRAEMEKRVLTNVRRLVLPFVEKLKRERLTEPQAVYLQLIEDNLKTIISPFLQTLSSQYQNMTPREIEIASLVREGKSAKEIASLLNTSIRSIEFHKDNLRRKLGLIHKKVNLRTHLLSLTDRPS